MSSQPKGTVMPLTTLDAVPALIVIDLQKGIVGKPTVHPVGAAGDMRRGQSLVVWAINER